ncbi:MAG: amidohydrolase [Flavisolibacter sp.]
MIYKIIFLKKFLAIIFLIIYYALPAHGQLKKTNSSKASKFNFKELTKLAYEDSLRLVEIFKDLHQHPELGYGETRTAGIIQKEWQRLGYKVISGIGKTGLVGILRNGEGPTVMYRTDMDALPIKEATGFRYASTVMARKDDGTEVPVMHACGHDAHITWILGVAKIMVELKSKWKGTLVLVAQPAEELVSGADAMVKDKMFEKEVPIPDYLFGMHTKPFPVGVIENCPGIRMAGTDQLDIIFHGIGGHGSAPHLTKDPIIMAATAILNYQSIVNRSISSQSPHVITVGAVNGGAVNNIIPSSAELKVNLRWFTSEDRLTMINGIKRVDSSIALANNLPFEMYPTTIMKSSAPPVNNDSSMVLKINSGLENLLHAKKMISSYPPVMVSEDFPLLIINSKKNPVYDFLFVGIANPEICEKAAKQGKEFPFYFHTPTYSVDLSAIPFGTLIGAVAVLKLFTE